MKKFLAIAVLVAACGGAAETVPVASSVPPAALSSSPPTTQGAPGPTPTSALIATPTPDPEAVRKTAAASYLAAASAYNKAAKALDKKYKTLGSLARVRAYYKGLAKIEGTFLGGLRLYRLAPRSCG